MSVTEGWMRDYVVWHAQFRLTYGFVGFHTGAHSPASASADRARAFGGTMI